jgi:hypothetical protein
MTRKGRADIPPDARGANRTRTIVICRGGVKRKMRDENRESGTIYIFMPAKLELPPSVCLWWRKSTEDGETAVRLWSALTYCTEYRTLLYTSTREISP